MKKILMALAVTGMVCTGANAQQASIYNTGYPTRHKPEPEKAVDYQTNYTTARPHVLGPVRYYDAPQRVATRVPVTYEMESKAYDEQACVVDAGRVCKKGPGNKLVCYKTSYAQNYKVCKGSGGYYICCDPNAVARGGM